MAILSEGNHCVLDKKEGQEGGKTLRRRLELEETEDSISEFSRFQEKNANQYGGKCPCCVVNEYWRAKEGLGSQFGGRGKDVEQCFYCASVFSY